MCGITGFWSPSGAMSPDYLQEIINKMSYRLQHRGPDEGGSWVDASAGIALGHRRLSILDLSIEGHQPMISLNNQYVVVFNGEIYNFLILRKELEQLGYRFRGCSDTEVMLASFCQWGLKGAVKRFIGMFAFALWDLHKRVLHLGRDRLGEKPLYYTWIGKTFLFASELKALRSYPDLTLEINRDVLALYLRHNYIPAPYSIYKGVYKLPPASLLTVQDVASITEPVSYWSVKSVAKAGITHPFIGSETEAITKLDTLLRNVISLHMIADVPLGAFLSGGIDSSTIVALMQAQSSQPIKTFTIGFTENDYNEAQNAKAVAKHLGTDHKELYVTSQEAITVIPKLPTLYDEPFSDPSQIPTFLVAQLAKQQVTVSLSGDGGDELFGGYNRYFWGHQLWQKFGWMPYSLKKLAAQVLISRPPEAWNQSLTKFARFLPTSLKQKNPGEKIHKLVEALGAENPEAMYTNLVSHWKKPTALVFGASELTTNLTNPQNWVDLPSFMQQMMYLDTITYLPDDILLKVDRASMGVSLEARVPFLDHRVVEFAWQIPLEMKLHNRQSKWLLRQVLHQYVPSNLVDRPKMGFAVPIDTWLRGQLRDWAESLLDECRLRQEGFFDPQPIRQKWTEHLSGSRNWQYYLWDILMFQAWLEKTY